METLEINLYKYPDSIDTDDLLLMERQFRHARGKLIRYHQRVLQLLQNRATHPLPKLFLSDAQFDNAIYYAVFGITK